MNLYRKNKTFDDRFYNEIMSAFNINRTEPLCDTKANTHSIT